MDGVDGLLLTFSFFLLIDLFSKNGSVPVHRSVKSTVDAELLTEVET